MKNEHHVSTSRAPVARGRARPLPGNAPRPSQASQPRVPVAANQKVRDALSSSAGVSEVRAMVKRVPAPAALEERAYVAVSDGDVGEMEPLRTQFFDSIKQVQALTWANQKLTVNTKNQSLAKKRGYARDDLFAIAEIAYHYLMNGGTRLALALYEGLCAVAPDESYFALGLGLTHDHLGEKREAFASYARAAELDPHDARPDVNRAELFLEDGDVRRARQLLERGAVKAKNRGDSALERKATAMLDHLRRAS